MKATLEELLKEVKIRFGEDWMNAEIGKKLRHDLTDANSHGINSIGYIWNSNGKLRSANGKWATAEIDKAPEKWVVEKDESNPIWEDVLKYLDIEFSYFDDEYINQETRISDNIRDYEGHQFLTLSQWKHFFGQPDLSMLNKEAVFFIESTNGLNHLFKEAEKDNKRLRFHGVNANREIRVTANITINHIKEIRKATPQETVLFYSKFPELRPLEDEDWCFAYDNDSLDILKRATKDGKIYMFKYKLVKDLFNHHHRIDLNKPLKPQIDKFLKL